MGHFKSVYDFNICGDKWLNTDAGSVLFCIKMDHKMHLKILYVTLPYDNIYKHRNFANFLVYIWQI
jgi:hypothetical protein